MATGVTRVVVFIVSLCVVLFVSESKDLRYIVGSPENEAVASGSRVTLVCVSDQALSNNLDWVVTPVGQSSATVIRNCQLNPAYEGIYDVEQPQPGTCNIVVLSATVSEAGAYLCQQSTGFDPPKSSQLVVLESDPVCSISSNGSQLTGYEVVEGDLIRMTCTVRYTTNLSPLSTQWTDPNDQDLPDNEWTTDGQFYSYVEFSAQPPSVNPLTAYTFFLPPTNPPTSATNTPSYNHTWSSPTLTVQYCPRDLTIVSNSVNPDEYSVGDTLTCSSNAFPSPSYYWINLETDAVIEGQSIVISSEGEFHFQCTAYNYINGAPCNKSLEIAGNATALKTYPRNTALVTGTNGTFHCKFGKSPLSWIFTAVGQSGVTIAPNCQLIISVEHLYDLDQSGGSCNLIISEAKSVLAGVYTCQDTTSADRPPTAQLVVLDSDPICGDDLVGGVAVAGDRVHFSCRVDYTGNLVPTMTWTTATGEVITNATDIVTASTVRYIIDIPIYPDVLPTFICKTNFPAPFLPNSSLSAPAKNPPDYEYVWYSTERVVYYCPTDVNISSTHSSVFIGDVLTCSANGFPDPSFFWTNLLTGDTFDGPTLTVSSAGRLYYQCTAVTEFSNGANCSASSSIDVQVNGYLAPENVAVVRGVHVTLPCRHQNSGIIWTYSAADSASSVTIAANCQILPAFVDTFAVNKFDQNCDLIIKSISSSGAGTYTCQDPYTTDLPPSCIVVVLESDPDCFVKLTEDECETRLSCAVNFTGQLTPKMNWTDQHGKPVEGAVTIATTNQVTSYVDVKIEDDSSVISSLHCTTAFDPPSFTSSVPSDIQTDPAKNAPNYTDIWTSPTIILNSTWPEDSCPTLIQQNVDRSNSYAFYRSWNEYSVGFGTLAVNSSYWIGLERLHQLTRSGNCSLHVDLLEVNTNRWYTAEYDQFQINDENDDYRLSVSGYDGNAGDAMAYHNGRIFTTYDRDAGCADYNKGGFWYNYCYQAGVNNSPDYRFAWRNSHLNRYMTLEMSRLWLLCGSSSSTYAE